MIQIIDLNNSFNGIFSFSIDSDRKMMYNKLIRNPNGNSFPEYKNYESWKKENGYNSIEILALMLIDKYSNLNAVAERSGTGTIYINWQGKSRIRLSDHGAKRHSNVIDVSPGLNADIFIKSWYNVDVQNLFNKIVGKMDDTDNR